MSDDATGPVTMAELESSDPGLAAQVRRARRAEDTERIKTLARRAQEAATAQPPPSAAQVSPTGPEPAWR